MTILGAITHSLPATAPNWPPSDAGALLSKAGEDALLIGIAGVAAVLWVGTFIFLSLPQMRSRYSVGVASGLGFLQSVFVVALAAVVLPSIVLKYLAILWGAYYLIYAPFQRWYLWASQRRTAPAGTRPGEAERISDDVVARWSAWPLSLQLALCFFAISAWPTKYCVAVVSVFLIAQGSRFVRTALLDHVMPKPARPSSRADLEAALRRLRLGWIQQFPSESENTVWLRALGVVIVAAGVLAFTQTDKVAAWFHVPSGQQAGVNAKGPAAMRAQVLSFYNAINRRDFQRAYSLVSPSFRAFKPYDQFVEDYFATQSVGISTGTPIGDYVPTTINATDKIPSGTRSRTFEGGWHVIWSNGSYRLDRGAFRTVADTAPEPTPTGVEGATNETGLTLGSAGDESVAMVATPDTECAELKALTVLHDEFASGSIDEQMASQRLRSIPGYAEVKAGSSIERTGPEVRIACAGAEGIPLELVPVRVLDGPQAGTSGFAAPANIRTHNDGLDRSSEASSAGLSSESATPQSASQGASVGTNVRCPEQQHIKDFILGHPTVPPPPPDTGLGYFAQRVSELSVAQQQIVYQRSVAYNPLSATADDIVKVLANHCRLADLESLAGRLKNPTAAWKTADYAPNLKSKNDVTSASADLIGGEMAAELAVEARGLVSDAVVERLYIAFEPVIPLATIPMKFREGSVTALTR